MSQDCLFFAGTVRYNLTPWGQHEDCALRDILTQVGLELDLDATIATMAGNLSTGQRHLLSMARMLLGAPKLMLLDEPTAHLDQAASDRLLATMHRIRPEATTLHVAHHLETVVGYDRVLVMAGGRIAEHGSPSELLQDGSSLFSAMADARGQHSAGELRRMANATARLCAAP